ncbi:PP2C family protein-serine/threonine phosphatase [Amycolatopsis vastitatis]|uniref:Protein phosphatase n=1 Tax=Amycolatopsis vastitatis TaxID=1905142 RepID=A0A229SR03_9PSEU|nr:PP2C family protein-serine/threonine phosphatase [Amycolatopsis vastitatis]OXM61204.1 protein phosphatase [Amycolatopsis vastitatis]
MDGGVLGPGDVLAAAESAPPVESVEVVARDLAKRLGAFDVSFLLVDLVEEHLVRLTSTAQDPDGRDPKPVDLRDSVYERVLRTQRPSQAQDDGGVRVVLPVTNRGDCVGLLEVAVPFCDEEVLAQLGQAAHALAYVIVTDRRFTDRYHTGRRTTPMSLAAEIQHQLLPTAPCCEAAQFTIAGALVPADDIGGDTYDYTLDRDTLHLSITDAAGHDVASALTATLLVGALRGARRAGLDLPEQAGHANQALLDHGDVALATGLLLRVDLHTGGVELVNAGHPAPLLLRDGVVEPVELEADLLFGVRPYRYRVQRLDLRPGDRLVLLTDGMFERDAADADLPALIHQSGELHTRELVRAATRAVTHACHGHLQDDATVLCLDWHGTERTQRQADNGADTGTASPPGTPDERG